VLGVLPGIVGNIQAAEAIDLILSNGAPLIGRLLVFNALTMKFKEFKLKKNPECPVCGQNPTVKELIDYEALCGVNQEMNPEFELTARELKRELDDRKSIVILDVRQPFEYQISHIEGSKLIPLGQLTQRVNELDTADQIVAVCHTGVQSAQAVRFLNSLGFKKVKNLRGGIDAWTREVDPSLPLY